MFRGRVIESFVEFTDSKKQVEYRSLVLPRQNYKGFDGHSLQTRL